MASKQKWPEQFQLLELSERTLRHGLLFPFAADEVLGRYIGRGAMPIVHIWQAAKGFVLGLRDRRLPYAEEAMDWLKQQGYEVIVRNSGGAAVPLDAGVVNISIIFPSSQAIGDFRSDFDYMVSLLQHSLQSYGSDVKVGEITGAYCPGDYDVSVHGRKFCGIAQRRQAKAFIIQAFVVVEGSGDERSALVRAFYERATARLKADEAGVGAERHTNKGVTSEVNHPIVKEGTMASLQELLGVPNTAAFIAHIKSSLAQRGTIIDHTELLEQKEHMESIIALMSQLKARYNR
mgnify:CR=1 FL=1